MSYKSVFELGVERVNPNFCFSALLVPLVLRSVGPSQHRKTPGSPSPVGEDLSEAETKPGGFVDDGFCCLCFQISF